MSALPITTTRIKKKLLSLAVMVVDCATLKTYLGFLPWECK